MSLRRRMPSAAAKRGLLAGAAVALVLPVAAHAQPQDLFHNKGQILNPAPVQPSRSSRAAPVNNDGLAADELYMEADELIRDDQAKTTTARGSVEVRYQGRTLRADRVVYQEGPGQGDGQGVIRAYGHVQTINADGTTEFADQLTLDDKMRAGVALGFSARLQDNVKIAGASAVRRNENIQELNRAIYTPCAICAANGKAKAPTWSISADRVVQDKAKRIIYYRNARIHILGVPLIYLPVFWHADPQADRASGLLAPRIGFSNRRGFSYEQPYLQVLSPSSDLVISPQINTKVNPLLNGEYRKRFYSGDIDIRFGYTHDRDFDSQGRKFGDDTNRSYILGHGAFQLDDKWRWGFTAERTSDKLLFDKYEIGRVYESRGPYIADDRRLISQLYAVRQDQQSYVSAAAISIQGLRPSLTDPTVIENNRTFPVIAPLVEAHYEPLSTLLGGRLQFDGSAVALTRDQAPNTTLPLPGIDSRRVTAEADWRRSFTAPIGLRIEPFVHMRTDAYSVSDILTGVGSQTTSLTTTRALGVAGADFSYPLYRRWRDATVVLEPLAQIAVSPKARQIVVGHDTTGAPIYLNEDSVALEFDESNLLRANKMPGYDLYEDGARLNVAGRGTVLWDDGRHASLLVGRSFRDKPNDIFTTTSGLRGRASDWILAGDAQPVKGLSVFARARLDASTFAVHRLEAGANVSSKWGSGYVRYLTNESVTSTSTSASGVVTPVVTKTENVDVGGEVRVAKNWGVTAYGNRDIVQQAWVIRDVGVFYSDDCIRVDVIYRKEDTVIGRLGPSESVQVRLTLATLGGPLYGR
ncbi:MAG: organic solvent tolerance protein OstA [Phenylobacterium sp.]|jgi:LPS-assembly protein|nr:organic solvent tolerance protein OstA [Phenylobacterium sp.]